MGAVVLLLSSLPSYALWSTGSGDGGECTGLYVVIDDVVYNVGMRCSDGLSIRDLEFLYDQSYNEIPRDGTGSHVGTDRWILQSHRIKSVSRRHMRDKAAGCYSIDAVKNAAAHQAIASYLGPRYTQVVSSSVSAQRAGRVPRVVFDVYFRDGHQVYFFTHLGTQGVASLGLCRAN